MPITIESSQKSTSKYNPDSEFEMKITNCDLCRSHFNMIHWRSEKVMFGCRETAEKGYEEVQNQHYVFFSDVFSATKRNAREKIGSNAEENSPEEKTSDLSCPPLGSKKMRTTKWNSNPNEISCKWTLSSYLYSILAVRYSTRDWGFGRRVSWWSGIPWIQAVWNAFCQKVCESTKLTFYNFLLSWKGQ